MSQTTTLILLPQTTFSSLLGSAKGIGSINQNILTITSVSSGVFGVGQNIRNSSGAILGTITGRITGVGGIGTYTITPGVSDVSSLLITSIGIASSYCVVGDGQHAASYYLGNKDIQTVNISATNLTGKIIIEASLYDVPDVSAVEPSQWFEVYSLQADFGANISTEYYKNSNIDIGVNVRGNFVWMRARIEDFAHGVVNWIKLSY